MINRGKLELTWVGKDQRQKLEPRVLVEDSSKSYGQANTKNMLIYGDNLLALKALEQEFAGKIKCIYVDPPYNTGSAFKQYDDGIEHSVWLSLMRDRIELLHALLADDGSLWVSVDDSEGHYMKVLCDEVFGRPNFVATIVWQKKHTRANDARWLSDNHDFILCIAKNKSVWKRNLLPREDGDDAGYTNPDNDPRGPWASGPCHAKTPNPKDIYEITTPSGRKLMPPPGTSWRFSKERFKELIADNRIYFGPKKINVPRYKRFRTEVQDGLVPTTLWLRGEVGDNQDAKSEVKAFNPDDVFSTPKPERLIRHILEIATNSGDLVLDSFAGSGTTGAVAHKMGRRWIMVELGEHCHTHIIPRMRKVIDGTDRGGISKTVGWKGGGGFRYYRLAETLLVRDKDLSTKHHPVYVINQRYDDKLLIRAICKIEDFRYRNENRLHGISSENRFLHVTTQLLTQTYLDSLVEDLAIEQSLLIYCTRRNRNLIVPDNIEIKKIPRDLLEKCDFEEDRL